MLYRVPQGFDGRFSWKTTAEQEPHIHESINPTVRSAIEHIAKLALNFASPRIPIVLLLSVLTLMIHPEPATAEQTSIAADDAGCVLNNGEQTIAAMLERSPTQKRPHLACHPILHRVARERALDMANRGYFYHVNPDGIGPNYSVKEAGYQLPEWWGNEPAANYIESIAAGYPNALAAWVAWMRSPSHRTHLLAADPFYSEQINYGVGVIDMPDSQYGHYYVVLTAPAEEFNE